jgi:hypothetical protein
LEADMRLTTVCRAVDGEEIKYEVSVETNTVIHQDSSENYILGRRQYACSDDLFNTMLANAIAFAQGLQTIEG